MRMWKQLRDGKVSQKIEKTERKMSFGDICVGVLGRGAWEEMVGEN